jgi:hypothetical protein
MVEQKLECFSIVSIMYLTAESSAVFILCRISQIIKVKFTASLYIQYTENLQHLSVYGMVQLTIVEFSFFMK